MAKAKDTRTRYPEEVKRAIVDRVRLGRTNGTETLVAVAEAERISPTNIQRWLKAFPEKRAPRKGNTVALADGGERTVTPGPFGNPVEVGGLIRAFQAYIDARIDARVKQSVADVLKRGIG